MMVKNFCSYIILIPLHQSFKIVIFKCNLYKIETRACSMFAVLDSFILTLKILYPVI